MTEPTVVTDLVCLCCNAPATMTFQGDEFVRADCSKHGIFLMVDVEMIDSVRATLPRRGGAPA